jgi:tetratricopeptide (TPR) repeat protein
MTHRTIAVFLIIYLFIISSVRISHAAPPQEALNQYIADLQKNPNDNALREKIIRYVHTMNPTPAIPTVVDEHIGKAEFILKKASAPSDFIDAANAIRDALMVAPWLVDYYNDLGVLYEKANQYEEATKYFEFYLKIRPDTPDAQKIRKKIGGLKYATQKAARESSPAAIGIKKQNEYEEWLKKLDGARYIWTINAPGMSIDKRIIEIRGKVAIHGELSTWMSEEMQRWNPGRLGKYREYERSEILNREFIQTGPPLTGMSRSCVISDDGNKITVTAPTGSPAIYLRER